jgi:hypothetical protein
VSRLERQLPVLLALELAGVVQWVCSLELLELPQQVQLALPGPGPREQRELPPELMPLELLASQVSRPQGQLQQERSPERPASQQPAQPERQPRALQQLARASLGAAARPSPPHPSHLYLF